ncbi:ABC transporter C family member 3 [Panicum miliaceum]|uniref:ABC transporter C family member 3 n=1 Tax=Panicum miliaceum TaxID=4540 RepID=A0A3L6T750_PANMI|nr:ABC transporter C family member 3 [Panicum miliaceum]
MGPLLDLGKRKTLDLDDVPFLDDGDSVHGIVPKFKSNIDSTSATEQYSDVTAVKLVKALVLTTWKLIIVTAVYALLRTVTSYVGPYLIEDFVSYLTESPRSQQLGVRVRSALIAIIYQKGLALSSQSRQGSSSGELINVVNLDAECVGNFNWSMHELWLLPVQITLAMVILYSTLGTAAFAALAATILTMLANIPLGRIEQNFQEKTMNAKDARMSAMSEILQNMRILKLQGWELIFLSKIKELRKVEMNWVKKYVYTSSMLISVFFGAPAFAAMVTFGTCILFGIPLETGKVLSALATFRQLQGPIHSLPDTISSIIQTKLSLDRMCSFLCLEELASNAVTKLPSGSTDISIEVRNGCFSWDTSSHVPTLQDLNFRVQIGKRVAICETVGSGKTSLLSCILGEIPKLFGEVQICGKIACVSQSPWIQSGTIEQNILFGTQMNRERYKTVLEVCSLKNDLDILPLGDQTIIGERGINLSGRQKQRIQIARALYQDADIFLFDDPFSAVDARMGLHLFKDGSGMDVVMHPNIAIGECLLGFLASKTVVYVTHHVEFLPSADLILVMRDGKITQSGDYTEILKSGEELMELVGSHKDALSTLDVLERPSCDFDSTSHPGGNDSTLFVAKDTNYDNNEEGRIVQNGHLVQEEEREKGRVGFIIYWKYITMAYNGALVPFILLAQIIFQVLQIGSNFWMAWAAPISKDVNPPVSSLLMERQFISSIGHLMDNLSRPSYNAAAMEWLCFRLDILSSFIFSFTLILLVSSPSSLIDPKTAGLAVTYGLSLNMLQGWAIAVLCSLENRMISVERMLQYTNIPSEPPLTISESRPNCKWPTEGEIELRNLHVRCAPQLPFVLKGLMCTFSGGKKTGIVGRTGGGKSTLIQALFRIVDPCIGQVLIDGIDICTIGLHDLRTRLSIIPQDPVMFGGTLRSNIDPLGEYSDEQIWEALDSCHLGDEVRKTELKLDSKVTGSGKNWSAGQRQLVCLGRVVLKRRKILVLDEATSSVDPITDSLIQRTLKHKFAECTMITIAHRITSVLDSDKVLLLDNGEIAEHDAPAKLLEDSSSLFSRLVSEYTMGSEYK